MDQQWPSEAFWWYNGLPPLPAHHCGTTSSSFCIDTSKQPFLSANMRTAPASATAADATNSKRPKNVKFWTTKSELSQPMQRLINGYQTTPNTPQPGGVSPLSNRGFLFSLVCISSGTSFETDKGSSKEKRKAGWFKHRSRLVSCFLYVLYIAAASHSCQAIGVPDVISGIYLVLLRLVYCLLICN